MERLPLRRVLLAVLAFAFLILVTGTWLIFYYRPSSAAAWADVVRLHRLSRQG